MLLTRMQMDILVKLTDYYIISAAVLRDSKEQITPKTSLFETVQNAALSSSLSFCI